MLFDMATWLEPIFAMYGVSPCSSRARTVYKLTPFGYYPVGRFSAKVFYTSFKREDRFLNRISWSSENLWIICCLAYFSLTQDKSKNDDLPKTQPNTCPSLQSSSYSWSKNESGWMTHHDLDFWWNFHWSLKPLWHIHYIVEIEDMTRAFA